MSEKGKTYITTAIDYVNDLPHIGTAYEKIGADVIARFYRLNGHEVYFQMGVDEHSANVFKAASKKGLSPSEYCKGMRQKFEDVWKKLSISYDNFIQTSSDLHRSGLQKLCEVIKKKGDIYKSKYEGWYCESCEAFYTDKDLSEGLCPNHKAKPKWLSEENYFFALSKYRDRLLKHIERHPEFILPESRRNEILSLLRGGLQDISISRSGVEWGIPFPDDPSSMVYVWVDALANYITGIGYGRDEKNFKKWWPADVHIIGKDITRFHCVIWPAILMSAGIELPKTIFGHGFIHLKGEKMSKTLGNVLSPLEIADKYGADSLRYYLLREGPFGRDGDFTWDHFIERYNAELANGVGNLISRTIGMIQRYQGCDVFSLKKLEKTQTDLIKSLSSISDVVEKALDYKNGEIEFHTALASIQNGLALCDRYINEEKPWELAKSGKSDEVSKVLCTLSEAIRIFAILLAPFVPQTARRIWDVCGLEALKSFDGLSWKDAKEERFIDRNIKVKTITGIFPRIETDVEEPKKKEGNMEEPISITDFAKVDLRIAKVLEAEKIEGTDRLLKLKVSLGTEERQIVAGIAQHYSPEELLGQRVVVVVNLQPAKLKGVESHGMLLAASNESSLTILTTTKDIDAGSKVK